MPVCSQAMEDQDINIRLFEAVTSNQYDTVLELVSQTPGPNVNERYDVYGRGVRMETPLGIASARGYSEIVSCLLAKGARQDLKMSNAETPLYLAASNGHLDVVRILLNTDQHQEHSTQQKEDRKRYANLRNSDGTGDTVLHGAIYSGDLDVIEHVVEAGADLNTANDSGWTAVHLACSIREDNRLAVLQYLFSKDRSAFDRPTALGRRPDPEREQWTCLHVAAWHDNGDLIEWLLTELELEDARRKDARGMTAWDVASTTGHHFRAIAAFVLKDRDNGSMNPLFDWYWTFRGDTFTVWSFELNNVCSSKH